MFALHMMAAVLALAFPAWDYYEAKRLRTVQNPQVRTQCYLRCIAVLWVAAFAAIALMPFETLWNAPTALRALAGPSTPGFMLVLVPALATGLMMPLVLARFNTAMREKIFAQLEEIDHLLPQSRAEIALFAAVSVTAGICEEVLFRGFLFAYLQASPLSLDPVATVLLASALFGFAHFGQGIKGMLLTGMVGLFLGALYIITGTLLAPIIVHILIDLRATALCLMRVAMQRRPAKPV